MDRRELALVGVAVRVAFKRNEISAKECKKLLTAITDKEKQSSRRATRRVEALKNGIADEESSPQEYAV